MISSFIGLFSAFALLTPLVISHWTMAQIENTTLPENTNDTRQIINLTDNTVTLINTTTNETIGTMKYVGNTGNMTTNETLAADTGNMTTNQNLTEKFKALSK